MRNIFLFLKVYEHIFTWDLMFPILIVIFKIFWVK